MTLKDAMYERHTVRKYKDKPLPEDIIELLNKRVIENNSTHNVSVRLVIEDESAFNKLIRLVLAKGVKNYFVLCGKDASDLDERLGYVSADLMLYARTLGLNTWYVGGTYSRKAVEQKSPGERVIGVVAVGYGETNGKPHKSKPIDQVSVYEGGEAPSWFSDGVKAALLAPTALNKQAFVITGRNADVSIKCENGIFSGADLGIIKYHFALGAGMDNFRYV